MNIFKLIYKKHKRYRLYKKLKRYRYLRDHNKFYTKYGQILAYIYYCEEYDNSLDSLLKIFDKDLVKTLFYTGMITIHEPTCGFKIYLLDSKSWKKYNKENDKQH